MDEFVFMLGRIAAKHDTIIAHAMLHAVAVWMDTRGVRGDTRPAPAGARGRT